MTLQTASRRKNCFVPRRHPRPATVPPTRSAHRNDFVRGRQENWTYWWLRNLISGYTFILAASLSTLVYSSSLSPSPREFITRIKSPPPAARGCREQDRLPIGTPTFCNLLAQYVSYGAAELIVPRKIRWEFNWPTMEANRGWKEWMEDVEEFLMMLGDEGLSSRSVLDL